MHKTGGEGKRKAIEDVTIEHFYHPEN